MNQFNRLFAVILGVCTFGMTALPWKAAAQFTQQFALQNSPEYEAEASRLREAPPREYDFSKALLSDVLRFLADDAGISFFGLPEGSENADRLVTFSLRTCPFTALETLAKANGIALIHDNGLWYLRPADDSELIGRVYQINYNSQEMVTKSSSSAASGNSSSGGREADSASRVPPIPLSASRASSSKTSRKSSTFPVAGAFSLRPSRWTASDNFPPQTFAVSKTSSHPLPAAPQMTAESQRMAILSSRSLA